MSQVTDIEEQAYEEAHTAWQQWMAQPFTRKVEGDLKKMDAQLLDQLFRLALDSDDPAVRAAATRVRDGRQFLTLFQPPQVEQKDE